MVSTPLEAKFIIPMAASTYIFYMALDPGATNTITVIVPIHVSALSLSRLDAICALWWAAGS